MLVALKQIREQFAAVFAPMKTHQKVTLVVLGLTVLAPFVYLMTAKPGDDLEPLQWGAAYDRDVLIQAEQALLERGYTDFKSVGQRIMAPKSRVDQYNAALNGAGINSPRSALDQEKEFDKLSVFTPREQLEARRDVILKKELRNMLRDISGIQDGEVFWARSKNSSRWPNAPMVTATVKLIPKVGKELTADKVEDIRSAVANMVPDLKRDNVVIVNTRTGRSFMPADEQDPFDSKVDQRKQRVIHDYQARISEAVSYIPDVVVSVNVDFDNIRTSKERKQQIDQKTVELTTINKTRSSTSTQNQQSGIPGTSSNQPRDLTAANVAPSQSNEKDSETATYSAPSVTVTETELVGVTPKAVRATVSIPDDYFEKIAAREGVLTPKTDAEKADYRKAIDVIRTREIAKVKQSVTTLLPPGSSPDSVAVASHTPVPVEQPIASVPVTEQVGDILTNWGSTLGLLLFAGWALLMLKKSMPTVQPSDSKALDSLVQALRPEPVFTPPPPIMMSIPEPEEPQPQTSRDVLQDLVQQDPAAAAAILQKWLQKA